MTRFLMIGGFLGAGKTTSIARLATHYMQHGQRVGLVTNDQAQGLVDTRALQAQGFHVGEVPGACFCCKFDDLVDTLNALRHTERPDLIMAEPVGSCTDLVATVIEPLRQLHGDTYELGPFAVLCKPEHGRKILRAAGGGRFSPQAAYIFRKQLEEADVIALNKIDRLTADEIDELLQLIQDQFPAQRCLPVSAHTGAGFDELLTELARPARVHGELMQVDYDTYAAGEAELGWLNATYLLSSTPGHLLSLDQICTTLTARAKTTLADRGAEPAHFKVLAQAGSGNFSMANLTSSDGDVNLTAAAHATAPQVELTINARVSASPDVLAAVVQSALQGVAANLGFSWQLRSQQVLRPGRPVPTHRMTT